MNSVSLIKKTSLTRRQAWLLAASLFAIVLGAAVGIASQPAVSHMVGEWRVRQAFEALPVPGDWRRTDLGIRKLDDGSVVLVATYEVPADRRQALRELVRAAGTRGWEVVGGNVDLSTAVLQREDLQLGLGLATPDLPVIRVELARYRSNPAE